MADDKSLEQVDLIDRKMNQINGLLAIMVNNDTLCSVETHHLTNALWGVQDILLDAGRIQTQISNNT